MVFTLSDLKHLNAMAELEGKKPEIPDVSILLSQSEDTSLTPLLLTLCNKLRFTGFSKHADQLEKKFLMLKTAQTHMYRAHKETGEDLINSAHPDGDNKIVPDVSDNLGDVETILSKHKKIVEIIQKEPTGKLAHYVQQCKIVLAEDANEQIERLANAARHNASQAYSIIEGAGGMMDFTFSNLSMAGRYYTKFMEVMNTKPLTVTLIEGVGGAESWLKGFEQKVEPSLGMGVSSEVWDKVKPYFDAANENLKELKDLLVRHYTGMAGGVDAGATPQSDGQSTKTVLSATIEKVNSELEQAKSLLSTASKYAPKAVDAAKKDFLAKVQGSIKAYIADVQSVLGKLSSMQESNAKLDLNRFGDIVGGLSRFSSAETYAAFKNAIAAYHAKLAQAFDYMKGW
jgi:hypothetical protein